MVAYRRNYIKGGRYFFTVNLLNRQSTLLTDHIDDLRTAFRKVKLRHPFEIDAIVILLEHLHCIWTLPESDDDFSLRWREIKSAFSRKLAPTEYKNKSRLARKERGIWQRRFWEHTLRDESDYQKHMDYIHYNPVKHGYVDSIEQWPYSSFHRHVSNGVYPKNWAGNENVACVELAKRGDV